MVTLYSIHLSTHKSGHVKGPVKAVRPAFAGHYRKVEDDILAPDLAAVRECLPYYYRKAFDRAGNPWFPQDDSPAYVTLRDTRGRYLNTVYMQPYDFKVESDSDL